jgi:glycolate oxidase
MFNEIELDQQIAVKSAFGEKRLLNPGRVFPTLHRCAEIGRMFDHEGKAAVSGSA